MEQKTREDKRQHIFNYIYVGMQLGLFHAQTYGDFLDLFEQHMKKEIEDYNVEDEKWAIDTMTQYEQKNSIDQNTKTKKNTRG